MNILIVDNDMALLRSLEIVLKDQGHHVMSFSSPQTAYLYIEQEPDVDVLILDFVMPEMNGEELLRRMWGRLPRHCKKIMITGHTEQIGSYKILQALGVSHVLAKPLDLDRLCELVA